LQLAAHPSVGPQHFRVKLCFAIINNGLHIEFGAGLRKLNCSLHCINADDDASRKLRDVH